MGHDMAHKPNSAAYELSLDDTLQQLLGTRTSRAIEIEDIGAISTLPEEPASLPVHEISALDDSVEIELSADDVNALLAGVVE